MEVDVMKVRNFINIAGVGKHVATIMAIFAAIFLLAGC
jgi:hypothetical protein